MDVESIGQFLSNAIKDIHEALTITIILLLYLSHLILDISLKIVPQLLRFYDAHTSRTLSLPLPLTLPTLHLLVSVVLLLLLDVLLVDLACLLLDGEFILHILDTDRHLLLRRPTSLQGLGGVLFRILAETH